MLGFTGVEDDGQEGVELAMNDQLAGKPGSRRVIKDRRGQIVEDVEIDPRAAGGQGRHAGAGRQDPVPGLQQLKQAIAEHKAKAGGIVVLDAKTGEVLALANLPTYNPNNRVRLVGAQLRNRAFTDTFEPGSTFKPFTVGAGAGEGQVSLRHADPDRARQADHRHRDDPRCPCARRADASRR